MSLLLILGGIILTTGGIAFIIYGIRLLIIYLISSLGLLRSRQWWKNEKNDGFFRFFFGGFFAIIPLSSFIIYAGLYWLDIIWKFGLPKPF